ncbi:MAG: endonuclease/exonuclease/phosphatase family protein [Thiohalocapsa sp.]|jgi:endonuclease/exonuclease/phosphatase family metal-dependent hydrolase
MATAIPPASALISVATYNVHRTLGRDGRRAPARIADVIIGLDADLVALQEVEAPVTPAPRALLDRLTDAGYETLLGPTIRSETHSYGNVLLTRLPVLACMRLDLSVPEREPRGLIEARLDLAPRLVGLPGEQTAPELRCMATHLGLSRAERRRQVARIVERIDGLGGSLTPGAPLVLLGDFNEWRPATRLRPVARRLHSVPPRATWPARWPLLALDRIFYRGLTLRDSRALRSRIARLASDHLPMGARFRIRVSTMPRHASSG